MRWQATPPNKMIVFAHGEFLPDKVSRQITFNRDRTASRKSAIEKKHDDSIKKLSCDYEKTDKKIRSSLAKLRRSCKHKFVPKETPFDMIDASGNVSDRMGVCVKCGKVNLIDIKNETTDESEAGDPKNFGRALGREKVPKAR